MLSLYGLDAMARVPLQQNTSQTRLAIPAIMSESDLPRLGLTTNPVFTIRSSISIDAPKQKVWNVLLDFPSYREWCVGSYSPWWPSILSVEAYIQESIHVCFFFPFRLDSSVL
jgi:hypothetical protein